MLFAFDYDGVIADSFHQLHGLVVRVQKEFGSGRPPTAEDFRTIENLTFDDMGRRIGLDPNRLPAFCARLFELQHQIWQLAIFPDMLPVLRQLAARHDLVVITSSQSQSVKANLDQAGLLSCFADILGGDLELSKARRIERSRRKFAAAREATFMVGDAVSDIRQGKLAGVRTVAVTWGFQDRRLLEGEHPDHIIDTPQALLSLDATAA